MSAFTVAVVQAGSVLFDKAACLDKVDAFTGQAAERGARLVVFPEAFVSGYPKGLDFGARLGFRLPEGRQQYRRYHESAVEVAGPDGAVLSGIAERHGVHLVVGVIEREGGTLYCSTLTYSPEGMLIGRHRKLMPTAVERLVWGCGDGSDVSVIDTPLGKIASAICWENYMPQLRLAYYARGVQLYCAPTVDDRDTWLATMRHIAAEGRCFVLSAVQSLDRSALPEDYAYSPPHDTPEQVIKGGSVIVGPLGTVLAGPAAPGETVLTAEVDLAHIVEAQFDMDVVGHYARPDVFQLTVHDRSLKPVVFVPNSTP
ncbi:carbon-nitrogen hydrolase family protein [Pararhodospirillum photometricum]|nr:carbon-nitrogen hydrolase family protein [Pararhodospirillum photometricum]